MDCFADVVAFRKRIGAPVASVPTESENDPFHVAWALIEEEFDELDRAVTLADQADACVDLIYVLYGFLSLHGIDPRPLWRAVHAANMTKIPFPGGKARKPPGFQHPDIARMLEEQSPIPEAMP